ncbi:MAG: membrane protein [Chloroflexota bacterium]
MPSPGQLALNVSGLFLFAFGQVLTLRSGLGLGPWDVLHQGISKHTPLTFGQATQLSGAVIILVGLMLGIRPGPGTVLNMILIGLFIDRILAGRLVPAPHTLWLAGPLDVVGILVVGLGSGLYMRSYLGAGPRDGLMVGLHRITHQRVAVVRAALESSVAVAGFLLGGSVGVGTILFALGIGPAVEFGFRVFGVQVQRASEVPAQPSD